ncbi:PilZ domain-containing protein [Bradyrhizobium sp. AZCC 2230]|uniref:PilZ domain-containing protein n=1 Tax=Bradyrhizobium sp. AZCC 2230 TaxID=3117021 RepID=UPI002FF00D1D
MQITMQELPFSGRRRDRETDFVKCDRDGCDRSIGKLPFHLEHRAMIERRATERIPINRAARLSFGEIRGTHPCMVRDISALGACISTPYYIFAKEFVLSFDAHSGIVICRVVWRKETLCGVSFRLRRRSSTSANDPGAPTNMERLTVRRGRL